PRGRPYPDMIRHLMDRLSIQDARKAAKTGDTRADLEEGANAGCGLVIGVTGGSPTREQLQALPRFARRRVGAGGFQAPPLTGAQLNSPRMYSWVCSSLGFSKISLVSPYSTR